MGTRRIYNHKGKGQGFDLQRMAQGVRRMLDDWGEWVQLDVSMAPAEMRLEHGFRCKRCLVFIRQLTTEAFQSPNEAGEMVPVVIAHVAAVSHEGLPELTWSEMQRIKRELCGEECEAVELYPRGSRDLHGLVERHLWVFPEGFLFPLGMMSRHVVGAVGDDGEVTLSDAAGVEPEAVLPPVTASAQAAVGLSAVEEEHAEEQAAADLAALRAELANKE